MLTESRISRSESMCSAVSIASHNTIDDLERDFDRIILIGNEALAACGSPGAGYLYFAILPFFSRLAALAFERGFASLA